MQLHFYTFDIIILICTSVCPHKTKYCLCSVEFQFQKAKKKVWQGHTVGILDEGNVPLAEKKTDSCLSGGPSSDFHLQHIETHHHQVFQGQYIQAHN